MEEYTKDLNDYIDAFRRRKLPMLLTGVAIFILSLVVALVWPPTFRSTATILIEEQEIPQDLVRSTITSYAAQRIEVISARVMTSGNLMKIVDKYKLYSAKRQSETTEEIVGRMNEDIKLENRSAEVIDPRSGRPTTVTIAFTLSYDGEHPEATQKVVNELVSLYLSENLKTRTEKSKETYNFITIEADKLSKQIAEIESKLAAFKKKNIYRLPELSTLNMQLIERIERELLKTDSELLSREDRIFYLESQLAQMNPLSPMVSASGDRILDPASRLKVLRSEYASASARYAPDHPDVLRLRREIEGLEKQTGAVDSSGEQAKELSRLRGELAATQEKYSAEHPDVIRLGKEVAALEEALKQSTKPEEAVGAQNPENPAYITLQAQLNSAVSDIKALQSKRKELKKKLTTYEKHIAETPEVEREYLALKREYDNSVARYRDIKTRQMEAEIGQELEKERKGERFSLIDPPQLPEEPISPNRPVIIFLGLIISVFGSLGFVAIAESIDTSVRGMRGVEAITGVAPLSVIPYMYSSEDLLRAKKIRKIFIISTVTGVVVLFLLIHFLWTPLDVLWFRGLRKISG